MNVQIPIIKNTDWRVGAEGILFKEVCSDWTPFLPVYEAQANNYIATQACAIFSAYNVIETQLAQQGIIKNFSDRFTAKMCGNTVNGSQITDVLYSITHDGWLLEEDYPFPNGITWNEYYKEITQELKDRAKKNLKDANWEVKYEWANINNCHPDLGTIKTQLKQAPLQRITSFGSGQCTVEHATELYKIDLDAGFYYIYDTYDGGIKKLPLDYPMPYLMKIVVQPKVVPPAIIPPITKDLSYGMMNNQEVKYLQQKLIKLGYLSKGLDTGNYLNLTKAAVSRFQWAYKVANPVILIWNGGKLVALATRKALNNL